MALVLVDDKRSVDGVSMSDELVPSTDPRELGGRLREARKAAGLTQELAAEELGVARTTLLAIEKGERRIQPPELVRLAGLYRRSVNELLRPGKAVSPFAVQLRSTLMNDEAVAREIQAPTLEFQQLCEDYFELERLCGAPLQKNYPPERAFPGTPPEAAGEDLAVRERLRLGLGDGPIPNLRLLLEQDVGLRVFYLGLPSDIAAMFSYDPQLGGCVVVNAKHLYERRRQSLAHEYAHFLTSRHRAEVTIMQRYSRRPDHERLANAFARSFLVPADGVTRRVNEAKGAKGGRFTYADICTLAYYYGVSIEAFTKRLEDLKLVKSGAWQGLKNSNFKASEARALLGIAAPPAVDDLLPPRYRFLALDGFRDGKLTEGQLARFLRVDRLEARRIVDESSPIAGDADPPSAVSNGLDESVD